VKEIRFSKPIFKRILLIVPLVLILLILILLIYSYFSRKSEIPPVRLLVNFEDNSLAQKVKEDYPRRNGDIVEYDFPIILESYEDKGETYLIRGTAQDFERLFSSASEALFEYSLDKSSGNFDFTQVKGGDSMILTLGFDVEKDSKAIFEYSYCLVRRGILDLFDANIPCGKGNCIVNRSVKTWNIQAANVSLDEKAKFFESYETDSLARGLFNFYITNDFGYFKPNTYKIISEQRASEDGTYQFASRMANDANSSDDVYLFWVLAQVTDFMERDYKEYEEINFEEYISTLASYWKQTNKYSYMSCEMSYKTILNLSECESENCEKVKEVAFNYCSQVIKQEVGGYKINSDSLFMPSELVFYNKIVKLMNQSEETYTQNQILKYYKDGKTLLETDSSIVNICTVIKNINQISSLYENFEEEKVKNELIKKLPEFSTMCDGLDRDSYCIDNIAQQLKCADALSYDDNQRAKEILYTIFYRYYYKSLIASKLNVLENMKLNFPEHLRDEEGIKLEEYGYFVYKMSDESKTLSSSTAQLFDSYYFLYILSNLENEE